MSLFLDSFATGIVYGVVHAAAGIVKSASTTSTIDCSAYPHAFDTKDRTHIHRPPNQNLADCSSQPCPHASANSISTEESLSDKTLIIPITATTPSPVTLPPAMSTPTPVDANRLMTQLIEQVAQLTANLQKATAKSSMNKLELFKGTSSAEARRFVAQFQSWALEQSDLTGNEPKLIKAALGFFSGNAADWATPYLLQFSENKQPFNGRWEDFV
ncbi:hypothetical protein DFH05DRAFT_1570392 [Lentinula detonsa]|uniref:Retrotransposon gag domain-containing protein n=1 Tax=Lentinula detonsa TaxID=2804962 RepID=A0A9W8U499_9AGAR|nr:hypothetical protein DFH05DRAFT_1570392 [Lentinula detonsa]